MRLVAVVLLAFGLGSCTPSDDARAREDLRQADAKARENLHRAEIDAKKAGREIDKDLHTGRDKIRRALTDDDSSRR